MPKLIALAARRMLNHAGCCLVAILTALITVAVSANPALEGYANYAALAERVKQLDQSEIVAVTPLAKTAGGREIVLLTIGRGDAAKKPAIAIVGGVDASHGLDNQPS